MILPLPEFWKIFKETPGALSCAEALAIMNIAAQAPKGIRIELGTHHGKSAIAAANSFSGSWFCLIDTIFSDSALACKVVNSVYDIADNVSIKAIDGSSPDVIERFKDLSYVFLDTGDHGEELVQSEIKLLEDRIIKGGILCFHDYGNQFTAVARAYDQLIATGKYEPISIDWQPIFDYVKEHDLENGNNSWHIYENLPHPPNFVGAIRKL